MPFISAGVQGDWGDFVPAPQAPVFAPSVATLIQAPPTVTPVATTVAVDTSAGKGVRLDDSAKLPVSAPATALVVLTSDPANPQVGQMWYRSDTSQFCIRHDASTTKRVTLA